LKATKTYPCTCADCGKKYEGRSPNSNWCDVCKLGNCLVCGGEFTKERRTQRHCSKECANSSTERATKISKSTSATKQKQVADGTFKVADRVIKEFTCVLCGKIFKTTAYNAKYCLDCKRRSCVVCCKEFYVDSPLSNTSTCSVECRGKQHSSKFDKTNICSQCSKSFVYRNKKDKLCDTCKAFRLHLHDVKCAVCGKEEQVSNTRLATYVTCSKECANKQLSVTQTELPVDVTCVVCGKVFPVHPPKLAKEKKTCSSECLAKFRSEMNKGENNPLYGRGHSLATKKKLSAQASIRHANGLDSFSKGAYISKISHKEEKYDSSWELERFKQLDEDGVYWTKRHGIRIGYWWESSSHYYVPDILIYTTPRRIEEIKPKHLADTHEKTKVKIKAGRRWAGRNGYNYVVITENELFVREED